MLLDFGNVVSKKETLKQLFYEETLKTNLATWQGTNVTVWFETSSFTGKLLSESSINEIAMQNRKEQKKIAVGTISVVKTRSSLSAIKDFFKKK